MSVCLIVCFATTAIAVVSVYFAGGARVHERVLPWTGGVLLGVGVFWILPEIVQDQGWLVALGGVVPLAVLLAWIDRYAYPICPFCAPNLHHPGTAFPKLLARRPIRIGWPLLVVGCVHSFLDGWAIALARSGSATRAALALSYGVAVHKVPESVAIGIVAARLTSNRSRALAVVGLIQAAMAAGSLLSIFPGLGGFESFELFSIPACSCLLLFGFLALEDEWRLNGGLPAIRAAAPGLASCGLAALATRILGR